jgi:hypothetical protein
VPERLGELTAQGLVEALAGIAAVRVVPAAKPLITAVLVAQVEVASINTTDEAALRRAWRQRQGGGALPLLLIADDRQQGCVVVLGPSDPAAATRMVQTTALLAALTRVAPLSRLEATREIADELSRLDESGIPGLRVRELLTLHTLDFRLRHDEARWAAASLAASAVAPGGDWQTVIRGLGYDLERRPRIGYLVKTRDGRRVAVVHPKASVAEISRLDGDGRPPEGRLLNDCEEEGVAYGLLAYQSRLRLFDAATPSGSASTRYLELDAATLRPDDKAFLGLLGPDYLADGGLKRLQADAAAFGVGLKRHLDETIRHSVLPALGRAAGSWATQHGRDVADDATREELERAALTLVFRCLFLLYAESSGYLPMDNRSYHAASLSSLVAEAHESQSRLGERSTSLWDRLALLVRAMRTGNPAWGVPAYNGDLFAREGFDGAATLELLEIADPDMATILIGLGLDRETQVGIDYSTLEIGNLGNIYEGLLSLRLSLADAPLHYDPRADVYAPASAGESVDVADGELLWQTHEGGRKGGGVYYTPPDLVRHLVRQTVRPAFAAHLEEVRNVASTDPAHAAQLLLDFAVLDPACGSAHFLVVVTAELADQVVRFLAETPLPDFRSHLERLRAGTTSGTTIDDVALIRRLVLKQCVFGVDVSAMGAEVAKLSLWLASFVPGLSLAYLGRNVIVGNSLIGVARPDAVRDGNATATRRRAQTGSRSRTTNELSWLDAILERALRDATAAVARVATSDDRDPDEVAQSEAADAEAHTATERLESLFDLWTAESFGVAGARSYVELHGASILEGAESSLVTDGRRTAREHGFLHWPLAFPHVFARERPGFDVVVGNPPWEQVMVKAAAFYVLFRPGLLSLSENARLKAIELLVEEEPQVAERMKVEQERTALEREYFASGEYVAMPGHPDLYKLFCQRYATLLRHQGYLGVVLPRSALSTQGSQGFRDWLFQRITCERIDTLVNSRLWIFDTHPQYTVALVTARALDPPEDLLVRVAGTATSSDAWQVQMSSPGVALSKTMWGPGWQLPLLRSEAEAELLSKIRIGSPFPYGSSGGWLCFAVQELNETSDRELWQDATDGWSLWKGESFDQYLPRGTSERLCRMDDATMQKLLKQRPGEGSLSAKRAALESRRAAVQNEIGKSRVAFRDISRATDSRTVRACLIPPKTLLTNQAPYLAFVDGDALAQATCLGVMNSLPFDWQARRFVEIHLNFFILEGLIVPDLDAEAAAVVARCAARLSCVDDRFSEFAEACGVEYGQISDDEQVELRVEIDARVARAVAITVNDLETLFADFTVDALPLEYRQRLRNRLTELT